MYYVIKFWGFLIPAPPWDYIQYVLNVIKNCRFLTPPPPFCDYVPHIANTKKYNSIWVFDPFFICKLYISKKKYQRSKKQDLFLHTHMPKNWPLKYLNFCSSTDYGRRRPERKLPSLNGWKITPTPKSLATAEAYFVCHISPIFQISLIYAFIGCP